MDDSVMDSDQTVFRAPARTWLIAGVVALLLAVAFSAAIKMTAGAWMGQPEYSHGLLVPLICIFLVWQRRRDLETRDLAGSWAGLLLVVFGLVLHAAGRLSAVYALQQYALVVTIYGVLLSALGWAALRRLWVPLLLLAMAIPLPRFLIGTVSAQLQLISSALGVWFIRLFGVSVFLEGNVIDLGLYKLQVAEACDGLRYLFPLLTLGVIMAYFYRAEFWKRALVCLSSIPITILMNSFRIGVIGVTVQLWGVRMAEGFLHEFQGWVVFMASAAIMFGEMVLLSRVGSNRRPWREAFAIDFPASAPRTVVRRARRVPVPLLICAAVLAVYTALMTLLPERSESRQARQAFVSFPMQLSNWNGRQSSLEPVYLDALQLNDYLLADYSRRETESPVNMYVAWYDSQRAGQSAHSPRTCMPGGGWTISDLRQIALPFAGSGGSQLRVNRALIERGSSRQLVYYWFQQRGRIITNEYLVKWYLLWDALRLNRTDGALVRLITTVPNGEDPTRADRRLAEFARAAVSELDTYVPN
jgi:exosortase D (VPLPA-CTERM-specific)